VAKKDPLDQFFTPDEVANYCVDFFKQTTGETEIKILEPCAGGGAFARAFEDNGYANFELLDIDPKSAEIRQQDFLNYEESLEGVAVVTNPPFGLKSALSVAFFNRAAKLGAEFIALLTLANHGDDRLFNKLDRRYELLDEVYVISDFIGADGKKVIYKDCRLVFQVFRKSETVRPKAVRAKRIWRDYWRPTFWVKCATSGNPIYLDFETVVNDESNYFYRKTVTGKEKVFSKNVLGFRTTPEVSIEDVRKALDFAFWRSWCGWYVYPPTINQYLDELYEGKTFKTKQFARSLKI
jgi:predicted RNA methylase